MAAFERAVAIGAAVEAIRLAPNIRVAHAPERLLAEDGREAIRRCAAKTYAVATLNSRNQSVDWFTLARAVGCPQGGRARKPRADMMK